MAIVIRYAPYAACRLMIFITVAAAAMLRRHAMIRHKIQILIAAIHSFTLFIDAEGVDD